MSRSRETLALTARLALLALVAGGLTAAAAAAGPEGQDPDGGPHVIRVERRIACEGEDCPEAGAVRKMIFVGEDGEVHELSGDQVHWVEGGHHGMLAGGRAGYLGVMLTPMTPELRAHQGAPEDAGVLVSKVIDGSPAARAGLRVGDVVTAVDSVAVATPRDLAHAIRSREDGAAVTLELWRDGAVQSVTAAVEEREGLGPVHRRIEIRCEGGDCEGIEGEFEPYDCGGAEQCQVKVLCGGDGCDCTVNGESVDCATIPGPHNDR
jgi:hypothetical protein